jgi:hypothetical protein
MFLRDGLVYVARFQFWGKGRHFRGSPFKNPYSVKAYGLDEALRLYERHLRNSPELLAKLAELEGKTLACWCAGKDGAPDVLTAADPVVCHGQIILKLIEEMKEIERQRAPVAA